METKSAAMNTVLNINDLIRNIGFILMLTWHYLVLFTPILSVGYLQPFTGALSSRQLILYASLAIAFCFLAILSPTLAKRVPGFEHNLALLGCVGLLATLGSVLCIAPPSNSPQIIDAATAILGISEALMMWLWLSCIFSEHRNYDVLREFSINMFVAGLLSLQICYLQGSIGGIASGLLPVASTLILMYEAKQISKVSAEKAPSRKKTSKHKHEDTDEMRELDWNQTFKRETASAATHQSSPVAERRFVISSNIAGTIFSMIVVGIFGFVFGLMQGSFVEDDIYLLMVNQPLVLLGISLAGLVIFAAPRKHGVVFGANLVHYYALVLVVIGIVVLFQPVVGDIALLVAEITILAGFNLFDSSAMMLGISSSMGEDKRIVHIASGGRPVVYSGLFFGLLLGHYLALNYASASGITDFVCGASIILLVATTIIPYYSYSVTNRSARSDEATKDTRALHTDEEVIIPPLSSPNLSHDDSDFEKLPITPWRSTCMEIANLYQLSPRETEVFLLLAKGRNAAYIWEKLVISPHTAKTHVANVYRKLEIHSSQELLDLVESFRKAEQNFNEDK